MKIGVISDIHIDSNKKAIPEGSTFAKALAKQLNQKGIELLLLAGDISSDYLLSQRFLDKLKIETDCRILFIPGNHDYWSRKNGEENTQRIYEFFKQQPESILEKPYIINDKWAVVGNSGWYDYGYADEEQYSKEDFDRMKYRIGAWNDKYYVHWGKENQTVAQWMLDKIEEDMEMIGDRNVILMTHIATHPQFVVPLPSRVYDYFNAFLGSPSYEWLYQKYPIKYSIMGHVHFRKTFRDEERTYISACLGNKKHWRVKNIESEIKRTMVTFEID
ncbi:metallophosphoesterase [Desemzia sp. RIT804]|uniref:metallophosphoesterase n=1 Tax=Desemzia sp. RIT 804 TaxID=2810209 RepID=UPI0019514EC6|nr:metallophosphoesterase [Desemzia sp. RIT 804]MBM6614524.1 metallophosphoesterase [Desemzia sp. RIT 804]